MNRISDSGKSFIIAVEQVEHSYTVKIVAACDRGFMKSRLDLDRAGFTRLWNRFRPGALVSFVRSKMKQFNDLSVLSNVFHKY
ncbi:MAG TPA: hypothetical protein EYG63_04425 [Gammaproteobacteria bacterium]|nr:hypothetical protein [Gammaproteobacteria bacterium]